MDIIKSTKKEKIVNNSNKIKTDFINYVFNSTEFSCEIITEIEDIYEVKRDNFSNFNTGNRNSYWISEDEDESDMESQYIDSYGNVINDYSMIKKIKAKDGKIEKKIEIGDVYFLLMEKYIKASKKKSNKGGLDNFINMDRYDYGDNGLVKVLNNKQLKKTILKITKGNSNRKNNLKVDDIEGLIGSEKINKLFKELKIKNKALFNEFLINELNDKLSHSDVLRRVKRTQLNNFFKEDLINCVMDKNSVFYVDYCDINEGIENKDGTLKDLIYSSLVKFTLGKNNLFKENEVSDIFNLYLDKLLDRINNGLIIKDKMGNSIFNSIIDENKDSLAIFIYMINFCNKNNILEDFISNIDSLVLNKIKDIGFKENQGFIVFCFLKLMNYCKVDEKLGEKLKIGLNYKKELKEDLPKDCFDNDCVNFEVINFNINLDKLLNKYDVVLDDKVVFGMIANCIDNIFNSFAIGFGNNVLKKMYHFLQKKMKMRWI